MLNEIQEFQAYTQPVTYEAKTKSDTTFLGRFTLQGLMNFDGMTRILTILARGYMYESESPNLSRARRALCAWCSIPEHKKATPEQEWQSRTNYGDLHGAFPELVDEEGRGWFCRHVHNVADFILEHPEKVRKGHEKEALAIRDRFDTAWQSKVRQYQIPIFAPTTKGAWTLRFDDILADALEAGPLQNYESLFPKHLPEHLLTALPKEVPAEKVQLLIAYYHAHKQEDTDWVVLPATSFDAYFGNETFSKKILPKIPKEILERKSLGRVSRFRVLGDY